MDAQASQLQAQIDAFGSEYTVALEWGLFFDSSNPGQKIAAATQIESNLDKATKECAKQTPDLAEAARLLLEARELLARAQRQHPAYVANNNLGVVPLFFTAIATGVVYFLILCGFLGLTNTTMRHNPAFWGLLGAILKALYWLQFQINKGLLRPRWLAYFIVGPFIGVLLGGAAALTVVVGAKLVTGASSFDPDWRTLAIVAFYSGYQWEWALSKIEAGAENIMDRLKGTK